jgi:hypothetical protein
MNAYKKYLKAVTTVDQFRVAFGDLARNSRGWMDLSFDIKKLPDLMHEDMEAAVTMAASMLRGYYNKEAKQKDLAYRLGYYRKFGYTPVGREKEFYKESIELYGLYDEDINEDELIPVIHGGDLGRITAALKHGRGYKMEVCAPNPHKGIDEETGLQFHSKFSDRSKFYARSAASQRVGVAAVLMAVVPRKYVYNNGDSGYGDEYNLPYWNYKYMQDIKVITELDPEYWCIEEYYKEHYLTGNKSTSIS